MEGVPTMRMIVFWILYWGYIGVPLFWENAKKVGKPSVWPHVLPVVLLYRPSLTAQPAAFERGLHPSMEVGGGQYSTGV